MANSLLQTILRRFKVADYPYVVENWEPLSKASINIDVNHVKKTDFIEKVMKKFKRKDISPLAVAQLDLLHVQKYSNTKLWKVLRIDTIMGKNPHDISKVEKYCKRLKKEVTSYLNAQVHCVEHNHAYWTRIAIEETRHERSSSSTLYIVQPPNVNYLIVTGLRASHKECIFQSLMTALHGHRVVDIHLSGHCLVSLMRLILSKHSQGAGISFGGAPRPVNKETLPENVHNENHAEKRRRDQYVEDNFGSAKQPRLEKVLYKLETKFKGLSEVPAMVSSEKIFRCQVKFEGPNVLEGIRNLAAAGLAELPMKGHLAQVHTMAKNEFLLKQGLK